MPRGGKRAGAGRKKKGQSAPLDNRENSIIGSQNGIKADSKTEFKESNSQSKDSLVQQSNQHVPKGQQTSQGRPKTELRAKADGSSNQRDGESGLAGIRSVVSQMAKDLASQPGASSAVHLPGRIGLHEGSDKVCIGQALGSRSEEDGSGCDNGTRRTPSPTGQHPNPSQSGVPIAEQLKLLRDPVRFCQTFCSSHTYVTWQRDFLNDCRVVDENGRVNESEWPRTVVLAAINGAGKTEIIADVVRYLLSTVPGCVIPITSPIYRQLEMLENYLKAQNHKFPGWTCIEGKLTAPNGNFARWFATDTPTSVESFHGKFLVRIIEEAKAFEDELWDQTNRWQPKLTIIVSSKGLTKGRFYEALTKHRSFNRVHDVDAGMCPWVPKKWIEEQIAQHGRESAIVKSMIFNEFSDVDVRNLINLDQLNRCKANPQPWRNPGFRVGGIDLSSAREGADKLPCVVRQGNKLFEPYFVPTCKTTMEAVGYITNWIKREQLKIIYIDNGGLGGIVMIDLLMQNFAGDNSVIIHRVNFGDTAQSLNSNCKNRGTELWSNGAHAIEMRDVIFQWTDKAWGEFVTQVTSREVEILNTGEIRLESKQKMSSSPDLADATFLCLIEPEYERKSITGLGKDIKWTNFKDTESGHRASFGTTMNGRKLGRG